MRLLTLLFILLFTLHASETPWSGKWDMFWKDGSVTMEFTQDGDTVTGHYYPYGGEFSGLVVGKTLSGVIDQDGIKEAMTLTLSPDQNSFFGTILHRDWINGQRIIHTKRIEVTPFELSSPYTTLTSFLRLGNSVRNGKHENLTHALACLELDEAYASQRPHQQFLLAALYFNVLEEYTIDLRTLELSISGQKEHTEFPIAQQGTNEIFNIVFVKDDRDQWHIKVPKREFLQKQLALLLKARGYTEVNPKRYLQLHTPRDTMRTFIEQIKRWEKGGKGYVLSTMNLSYTDPKVREWEAPILAQHLKQVLDRIEVVFYQEIPNDPNSNMEYHFYKHPLGNIVIAPYEVDGVVKWQFTPDTLASIAVLNEAMENLPLKEGLMQLENTTYFFTLRHEAKKISPYLNKKILYLEAWQWISVGLILIIALVTAQFLSYVSLLILQRLSYTRHLNSEKLTLRYLRPMRILTIGLIWSTGLVYIGMPEFIFSMLRLIGLLLITIGVTWLAYNVINLIMKVLHYRTSRTETDIDDILVSLIGSTLKIIVIIVGFFVAADIVAIPYQTVIAGLGIGGLAFAIAAKDTIANFFGSAIILADRPFVQGDEVKIGEYFGVVTHVGIRSTRIRTLDDTEVIIPNNQVSSDTVDNFSKREYRRIKSSFYLNNKTSSEQLNILDKEILHFLEKDTSVINKDILTGVSEFTVVGISFGVNFYVDAQSKVEYSVQQHRLLTAIAKIIKDLNIELMTVREKVTL